MNHPTMTDTQDGQRNRELVLAPNEYAYISDQTKGNVDIYVGPHKTSLAITDQPVEFNATAKRFVNVPLQQATKTMTIAPEGWYVVLKNPAQDDKHPNPGSRQSSPILQTGRKINVPGPCDFTLWPGQMARVLQGHHIRSNQFLICRVYDDKAANDNWGESIIKGAEGEDTTKLLAQRPRLTMGTLLVIRGTEASFYIPPTGIEVVPDEAGKLVRDAVTLERLEYCLLRDENGNKRYEQGPAVVFPNPTEVFHTRDKTDESGVVTKTRKFKAIELSETSGIYVKVIADYTDEDTKEEIKAGQELFITGKQTTIYYPREEHAIIKYGDQEIHYAIAIPRGEARYVLHRQTGVIRLVEGECMFLADPRHETILKRRLDARLCEMLYPGNSEALAYNLSLQPEGSPSAVVGAVAAAAAAGGQEMYLSANYAGAGAVRARSLISDDAEARGLRGRVGRGFTGDGFDRKNNFTEPRTITLDTKYQGAVTTRIWPGFAVMLVRASGERRVEKGPKTVLFEYDETPQILELSSGKPKTTDHLVRTVFLRTQSNKISDIIEVETKDFVKLSVKVSYRVNFVGDNPEKWFQVDNYVKFLCDHVRSRVRSAVRKETIEYFYMNSEDSVRDTILGERVEGTDGSTSRPGMLFAENNMHLYDVEILAVMLKDAAVEKLLVDSQRETINHQLALQNARRSLDFAKENETLKQERARAEAETRAQTMKLSEEELTKKLVLDLATLTATAKTQAEKYAVEQAKEEAEALLSTLRLTRQKEAGEQSLYFENQASELKLRELAADVEGVIKRGAAISPQLVEALSGFSDKLMVARVSEAMAPMALIGGGKKSVLEIVAELLKGTTLAKQLTSAPANGNGRQEHQTTTPVA